MFKPRRSVWALASAVAVVLAQSEISIQTFTDNKCSVASASSPNVSVALDECVTTVGMQSFRLASIPCAGGSATHVLYYAFSDGHCSNVWGGDSYDGDCKYAITAGNAFGSILLSCTDFGFSTPTSSGATTTITVGAVATGASPSTSSVVAGGNGLGSSSQSGSSSGSSSGGSNGSCGYSCLPSTIRIIIPVAASAGIILLLILYRCWRRRRRTKALSLQRQNQNFHGGAPASFPPRNNFTQAPTNMGTGFPTNAMSVLTWDDGSQNRQHNWSHSQAGTHSTRWHNDPNRDTISDAQSEFASRQHDQSTVVKQPTSTLSEVSQTAMPQPPPYQQTDPERQQFEPARRGRPNSSTFPFFQNRRHQNEG